MSRSFHKVLSESKYPKVFASPKHKPSNSTIHAMTGSPSNKTTFSKSTLTQSRQESQLNQQVETKQVKEPPSDENPLHLIEKLKLELHNTKEDLT